MSPELWFVLFLFVVLTIPLFVGAVAFINRAAGTDTEEEVEDLKQRIDELESQNE